MKDDQKKIEKLEKEIKKLKKAVEENRNKYLRVLADYQNLEKRTTEEKKQLIESFKKEFFLKLLPFFDNLEKAEVFVKDTGLKIVKDQFLQFLKNEGVEEIDLLGKKFDPYLAEAVGVVSGDKDDIVVEILRKGYLIKGKVLRVAQVKVSKKVTS